MTDLVSEPGGPRVVGEDALDHDDVQVHESGLQQVEGEHRHFLVLAIGSVEFTALA